MTTLTRAESRLLNTAEAAVDTSLLPEERERYRKIASEWAVIVLALRGVG